VLIFRQHLKQMPPDLMEAARLDGAGPLRYLLEILLPVSLPMIAALFTILFVLGWNQYLWPLMVATTSEEHYTIVRGIERIGASGPQGQAFAVLAMLPPLLLMLFTQKWITRGLTLSWK
ncbi:MAG: ABC transporter permease subunit, partial [Amphritea sp.]|nr:ABC transporter permease subunit [Amphritea sp.]